MARIRKGTVGTRPKVSIRPPSAPSSGGGRPAPPQPSVLEVPSRGEAGRFADLVVPRPTAPSVESAAQPSPAPTPSGLPGALSWLDTAKDYGERYSVPPEYILPLIQAESGGNPQAVGDNGASVGLFQLHERGVGYGLTVEERYDPQLQFDRMMPRIKAAYEQGRARGLNGRSLAEFVGGQAEVSVPESHYRYGDAYDWISEYLAQIMSPIDNSIIGDQAS